MLNITFEHTVYVCRTEADVLEALADIEERKAQKEAIRRGWLRWSEQDEPLPTRMRRVPISA